MAGETWISDHSGHQLRSRKAAELAERQFGAIARRQLLEIGFSAAQIRSWIRSGRLHRCHPGVYAFGRQTLGQEGELAAALLFAGPGSALGGLTALWWLGLLTGRPHTIHVDAPGQRASRRGIVIRHPDTVARVEHRGLPVVPLPAALLTASGSLRRDSIRLVLARAEFNRMLRMAALEDALAAGPRGTAAVRAALDAHLPQLARCASPLERAFVLLCECYGLPLPEVNARIGRYRPDMLWRDASLIVELDGTRAHGTPAQLASDARRQDELERRGYAVIRLSWEDVHRHPEAVAARLRRLLG